MDILIHEKIKSINDNLSLMLPLKLAHKDSNLEMTESESVALPFGDGPLSCRFVLFAFDMMYYITL